MVKPLSIFSILFALALFTCAHAQEEAVEDDEQVLDTVIVTGLQNDDAMAAFRAGDYDAAEIGFLDNARCALRRERNLSAAIESARSSSFRSEINPGGQTNTPGNLPQRTKRTCAHRGFQMYMAGLSQIQLGKPELAKRNFEKATVQSKILYDAHYKLGLIALLEGDQKTAKRQLKKVEGILKRCRRCPARQEILDRQAYLKKAINGDVRLR